MPPFRPEGGRRRERLGTRSLQRGRSDPEGEARNPGLSPLRKRKQDALEDESRRPSASGPSYRRDRGEEETGEGDAPMLDEGPAAHLPRIPKKRGTSSFRDVKVSWRWEVGRPESRPPAC